MFTRLIAPRPSITAGRNVFTNFGELIGTPNRPKLTPEDIKQLEMAMHKNKASE